MSFEEKEKLMRENLDPYSLILLKGLTCLERKLADEQDNIRKKTLSEQIKIQKRKISHIYNLKTFLDRILDLSEFIKDSSLNPERKEQFCQKREFLRASMTKEVNIELNMWAKRNRAHPSEFPPLLPKSIKLWFFIFVSLTFLLIILPFLVNL